jgi:hypothetical protein
MKGVPSPPLFGLVIISRNRVCNFDQIPEALNGTICESLLCRFQEDLCGTLQNIQDK